MAAYEKLAEEVITPSSAGLTSAEAAAQLEKFGRNEVLEEKEPLWRMFAMQFVGTMPLMVSRDSPPPLPPPHTHECIDRSCPP